MHIQAMLYLIQEVMGVDKKKARGIYLKGEYM